MTRSERTDDSAATDVRHLPPNLYMLLALAPIVLAILTLIGLLIYHALQ